MNTRNFGIVEGRLTRDPYIVKNEKGSRKVMLTVAVQNDYKNKDGKRDSQFVSLEGFIPAEMGNGVYDLMHKGDMVGIEFTVRTNNYTDKNGKNVYGQVLFIQSVDLKETKKATAERAAKNTGDKEEPAPAPAAEQPTLNQMMEKIDDETAPF